MHPNAVPTVDAAALPPEAVVLDVREDEEWLAGHIPGALHVPMMRVPQQLQHDPGPLTADATIIVVCKVGARSAQVTAWLRRQGYNASNLAGGMYAWEAHGGPIEASDNSPPRII